MFVIVQNIMKCLYFHPTPHEVLGQERQTVKPLINSLENAAGWYRICFSEVISFLNLSTSLDTNLATETRVRDGQYS
jgi:hypothetical protein